MDSDNLLEKKSQLLREIQEFAREMKKRHLRNYRVNTAIVLFALIFSSIVTIAGFLDQGKIAAFLGVSIAFLIAVQNAFPIAEKSEFYRTIADEGENLQDSLNYQVDSDAKFQDVVTKFQTLRKFSAEKMPKGRGMETVKDMYKEMTPKPGAAQNP